MILLHAMADSGRYLWCRACHKLTDYRQKKCAHCGAVLP
jgi:hypothetical protein